MAKATTASSTKPPISDEPPGIVRLGVAGLKSIATEQSIDIRPLTILAGANSSGKSSFMQGILLLKQTLEAPYDPGPLRINGPNVGFTSSGQIVSLCAKRKNGATPLCLHIGTSRGFVTRLQFSPAPISGSSPFILTSQEVDLLDGSYTLTPEMPSGEIDALLSRPPLSRLMPSARGGAEELSGKRVIRNRCFLEISFDADAEGSLSFVPWPVASLINTEWLRDVIHLPGLRGNPARDYPVTAVGRGFPGPFDPYVASIISAWGRDGDAQIKQMGDDLSTLGLTWKVEAKALNDTQVEIQVGRLPRKPKRGGANDLVNIADVGFGVSQTLPVVVALLAARPGQLVYIEQPEIHLHPKAQVAMAKLLANAAKRGVRVVVETHSSLLLTGVQTLVAKGDLDSSKVVLHWFQRDDEGQTSITSADVDEAGRFGEWPVDFADVAMDVESRYLDAAEKVLYGKDAGR